MNTSAAIQSEPEAEATAKTSQGALSQLSALRGRLAEDDEAFAQAARLEADAERFCELIRTELKSRRLKLGLRQSELAARLDLSQSAISKAEGGGGDLSLKTVFRIAAALGFSPMVSFAPTAGEAQEPAEPPMSSTEALAHAVMDDLARRVPEIVQEAAARLAATD